MSVRPLMSFLTVFALASLLSGCGSKSEPAAESTGVSEFKKFDAPGSGSKEIVDDSAGKEQLRLKLKVGDRFPLMKTVQQDLIQTSAELPGVSQSRLELLLTISVEAVEAEQLKMRVDYQQVKYNQNIAGRLVKYDSTTTSNTAVPQEVRPYAGLVGNGFSFWLGQDNKIRKLVDFDQFLERCTRHVPVGQRKTLLNEIASTLGDDGVANFVDDSIGLMPFDSSVANPSGVEIGTTWKRDRRLMQPTPVHLQSTCKVTALDDSTAAIDVFGEIAAAQTYSDGASNGISVKINGGRSVGRCRIDRKSGLPIDSRMERQIDMSVEINGSSVNQKKLVVTTIRAFPEAGAFATRDAAPKRVVPANYEVR